MDSVIMLTIYVDGLIVAASGNAEIINVSFSKELVGFSIVPMR